MGDLQTLVRQPKFWVRIVAAVCSIIVFGCIANKGWVEVKGYGSHCVFNDKSSACHFGVAIGVISLLGLMGFILTDFVFALDMLNDNFRRASYMAELLFSAIWTIMWFTSFVFLADTWRKTKSHLKDQAPTSTVNNARSAVAFSFFSLIMFVVLAFLTARQLRKRDNSYEHPEGNNGYGGAAEPYQQPNPSGEF